MGHCANGIKCGAVERVKRNTLRWFGHIEGMKNEEVVKKVYVRWSGKLKEYIY